MARWLLKTEPTTYSFDDLLREKKTVWSGVANPTALKHIRSMKKNDDVLIYHTGNERAIVGMAKVASNPYPDPKEKDAKLIVMDVQVGKPFARPVTLDEIKSDPAFIGWDLLRIGRLSVVPVSDSIWKHIEQLARDKRRSVV